MENENFNNLKMMMDIKVPMSDGICLSTNIYLPKDNLPCPIILQRSPYGTNTEEMVKEAVDTWLPYLKIGKTVTVQVDNRLLVDVHFSLKNDLTGVEEVLDVFYDITE